MALGSNKAMLEEVLRGFTLCKCGNTESSAQSVTYQQKNALKASKCKSAHNAEWLVLVLYSHILCEQHFNAVWSRGS